MAAKVATREELREYADQSVLPMPKAARVLGVGVRTAYREAHSGTIPSVTIGRRLVVPTHKLFAMLGLDVESGAPAPADRAAAGCGEPATAV